MSKVVVTGSNGFVGKALCESLVSTGENVIPVVRKAQQVNDVSIGNIGATTDWKPVLLGAEAVVHLAARVHVMNDKASDPLMAFREVNVEGTNRLAEQAVEFGVKRFVYVSSIKVNGENTNGNPFTEDNITIPTDPYGISKYEAEQSLRKISDKTGMDVVIIRPPLVYGPGVGGNFLRLMKLIERGVPLPLGSVCNSRSMVSLSNLVDLLICCLKHPNAAGETFLVSDGIDWSTPELIKRIAYFKGNSARLFSVPRSLLKLLGLITGQSGAIDRLCDSLEINISKAHERLDWLPPQSPDEGVRQAVECYLKNKND